MSRRIFILLLAILIQPTLKAQLLTWHRQDIKDFFESDNWGVSGTFGGENYVFSEQGEFFELTKTVDLANGGVDSTYHLLRINGWSDDSIADFEGFTFRSLGNRTDFWSAANQGNSAGFISKYDSIPIIVQYITSGSLTHFSAYAYQSFNDSIGTLLFSGQKREGLPIGMWYFFYNNGRLRATGSYSGESALYTLTFGGYDDNSSYVNKRFPNDSLYREMKDVDLDSLKFLYPMVSMPYMGVSVYPKIGEWRFYERNGNLINVINYSSAVGKED